ncbi:MAG: glycosyltransferase family 4 protein [Patescibacteria group bacterium]
MNIVWFSWKDIDHPQAGGAETVSWQIMLRLVKDGHQVKLITARYKGSTERKVKDGVEIIRGGGRLSVYPKAFLMFRRELSKWPDLIIDEMNTLPFGVAFYSRRRSVLLTYQLARKVWLFQARFPLSWIGYVVEPLYLFIMSLRYRTVLTESESTRQDLARYGFAKKNTHVFRVSTELEPLATLGEKTSLNNVLILGAMRPMKQTLSAVKGFELARDKNPSLRLTIAGDSGGSYAARIIDYVASSRHADAIEIPGRVSAKQRIEAMRSASVILVTSIKEGWGLIVTEANTQGTPAIAFDSDGLRDSVVDGETGLLVKPGDVAALGQAINSLLGTKTHYESLRKQAWLHSQQYTFDNSYSDFANALGI